MQWSQIKTIFILCFLLLNIYLLILFLDKQEQSDLGILENEASTLEEELKAEDISYVDLPGEESKESFISVGQKSFTEEELATLNGKRGQELILVNETFIISQFDKYPSVSTDDSPKDLETSVREKLGLSEEYVFWNWNEEFNVLIFFQLENDRPVYFNRNGMILVFLNEESEVVFYTQSMLGEAEPRQEKKTLIKPIKAIETLYNTNELNSGDQITKMDIGFHTRVPSLHGVQVFAPTWKVTVNHSRSYFVNAIEGFVFFSNEFNFLEETITLYQNRIKESENRDKINSDVINILSEKVDNISWGG